MCRRFRPVVMAILAVEAVTVALVVEAAVAILVVEVERVTMLIVLMMKIISFPADSHRKPMSILNKQNFVIAGNALLLSFPVIVQAAPVLNNPPKNANDLLNKISTVVINPIIFVMFGAAFVVFLWGLVEFVAKLDNEEARSTGGKHMLWGLIGMAVMAGVVGIVNIIQNTIASIGG